MFGIKLTFGSEKDKRLKAVLQYKSGSTLSDVAQKYGVDASTIRDWVSKFDAGGAAALDFKAKPIERSKIDPVSLAEDIVTETDQNRIHKLHAIFETMKGEQLKAVAEKYGVSVQGLLKWRRAYEAGKL